MCVALYLTAAQSGSPLVSLAVSIAMLVVMLILLVSGLKAIWSAFNRLFEAFGQASGGAFLSPGQAATKRRRGSPHGGQCRRDGRAIACSGCGQPRRRGRGWGAGGQQRRDMGTNSRYDAGRIESVGWRGLSFVADSGLRDSPIGEATSQYLEGASVRQVGESALSTMPVMGKALSRVGGASVGAALLTDRNSDNAEAVVGEGGQVSWQQPLLNRGANNAVTGLIRNPNWASDAASICGNFPLYQPEGEPVRRGDILSGASTVSLNNAGDLDGTLDDDFKRDLSADRQVHAGTDTTAQGLSQAAQALNNAGVMLSSGIESLWQVGQLTATTVNARTTEIEGRLNVAGMDNLTAYLAAPLMR